MALVEQNLGRNVLGGAADGVGAFSDDFGETEVDHFQVAVASNHDVFGLKIPVADLLGVEVLKDGNNLRCVKSKVRKCLLCVFGREITHTSVIGEKVSTCQQLCNKINEPVVLVETVVFHLKSYRWTLTMNGCDITSRIFFSFSM